MAFEWQQKAANWIDSGVGYSQMNQAWKTGSMGDYKGGIDRALSTRPDYMQKMGKFHAGRGDFSMTSSMAPHSYGSSGALGATSRGVSGAARVSEKHVLGFANKLNEHLTKRGSGVAGGFSTVGSMMAKAPIGHMAKSYGLGLAMTLGVEVGLMGKPVNMQTLGDAAWESVPLTIGMELAGGGVKGIAGHMGYQAVGEHMGLGPWGSLALQVAGSTYLPGVGQALGAAIVGYEAGKGVYDMHKKAYQLGKGVRRTEFQTGDLSYATAEAATMRQRSIGAIQKSHMNMRSMLGREATIMMGR